MIRFATVLDVPEISRLVIQFATESLLDYKNFNNNDINNLKSMLINLVKNHYLIIAEVDNKIIGTLGAVKQNDFWFEHRICLREIFWWIDHDYRQTKISAELFLRWQNDTKEYIKEGKIDQASLSLQPGQSNISLEKRGWIKVEEHWIKG